MSEVKSPLTLSLSPSGRGDAVDRCAAYSLSPRGERATASLLPIALACERDNSEMQARQGELAGRRTG